MRNCTKKLCSLREHNVRFLQIKTETKHFLASMLLAILLSSALECPPTPFFHFGLVLLFQTRLAKFELTRLKFVDEKSRLTRYLTAAHVLHAASLFNEAFFFLLRGPAEQHYRSGRNTWDRLRVCNKLCCAVPLRTKLMCRDFALSRSNSGFRARSGKRRAASAALPKQVFTSPSASCDVIRLPRQHSVIQDGWW